jgi:tetratricopeptide (TPR) repeat protein
LAVARDLPAAIDAYERLRERLATELGLAPSAKTRALVNELRASAVESATEPTAPPLTLPPPPALLARRFRSGFAGRERELAALRECWRLATTGERTLALVAGEPGIGKTRLAIELAARLRPDDPLVLYGRCHEEALVPYRPFVEALGPLVAVNPPVGDLHPLLPELRAAEPERDGEGARFRFFEAVDRLLVGAAGERPTLLLLDDLHWADEPALLLLSHLARSPQRGRLLVLGTYRDTDLGRGHPLTSALADLRRDPGFERVRLRGLDPADARQLMAGWLRVEEVPGLAPVVHSETDGNPFFIEEVLAHLRETGRPIAELGVPESVREAIGRRVESITEPAGRALSIAAVIGREFELGVLARVADLSTGELEELMEEALRAGLVYEDPRSAGRLAFSHSLVREALYAEPSITRRVRLHSRVAAALEALDVETPGRHLDEIAYHLYQAASAGEAGRAVVYATRAATRAMARLAYEDAAVHCAHALEILSRDGREANAARRCELLLTLGEARLRAGQRDDAREAFTEAARFARGRDDAPSLARAALGFAGLGVTIVEVDGPAVALLDEAVAAVGEADQALRARLLARQAVELYYAPSRDRSDELSREAVAAAHTSGDPAALGFALNARHVALWRPDGLEERLQIADEMIALGDQLPEIGMQGIHWRVVDLFEAGDLAAWRDAVEEHARRAEQLRLPAYGWYEPVWRATLAALDGRFEEAQRLADQARSEGARAGDANADLFAEMLGHFTRILTRRFADMDLEFVEDKVASSPAAASYRTSLVWIQAERGQLDEARRHWEVVAAADFATIPFDANWLSAMGEIAEAALLLGDAPRAAVAYELLAPYASSSLAAGRAVVTYGSAEHHLGLLALASGRPALALEHLERALTAHERMGSPPLALGTRWRKAQALAAAGKSERAARLAAEVRAAARPLGIELRSAPPDA